MHSPGQSLTLLLVLLSVATGVACERRERAPLNLLIVCIDTVRSDAFFLPFESGDELSPWTDRALRFDRAVSPSPWTFPSVASLFTGLYPARHGAGSEREGRGALEGGVPAPLGREFPTLAMRLSAEGYRTRGLVRQAFFHSSLGLGRGFEFLKSFADPGRLTESALEFIEGESATPGLPPFFLYLHYLEPHRLYGWPAEEASRRASALAPEIRDRSLAPVAETLCREPDDDSCRRYFAYVDAIGIVRRSVASIFDSLESHGLLERTVVLLTADHGEEFLDHQAEQDLRGTGTRRVNGLGHGHTLYQEQLSVPFLVWHPDHEPRRIDAPVSLIDVIPTVESWLGLDLRIDSDGVDLSPLLVGNDLEERALFASALSDGPLETAVARGRWKLIQRSDPEERVLYDLQADPDEKHPVSDSERIQELSALIEAHRVRAIGGAEDGFEAPADLVESLRALGYLESEEP